MGARLTLPKKIVADVLRRLVATPKYRERLERLFDDAKTEEKVAVIIPNREGTRNIGILCAVDFRYRDSGVVRVEVITMYDDGPMKNRPKGEQYLLFPKVRRIVMHDYDLDAAMKENEEEKKPEKSSEILIIDREEERRMERSKIATVTTPPAETTVKKRSGGIYVIPRGEGTELRRAKVERRSVRKIRKIEKPVQKSEERIHKPIRPETEKEQVKTGGYESSIGKGERRGLKGYLIVFINFIVKVFHVKR
jgi:hypothetical protein